MLQHFNQIIRLAPESLSPQERILLVVLEDSRGDYGILPTQKTLAARTGMSVRVVKRWLAALRDKGYLTTRQEIRRDADGGFHGSTTHYFIDYAALGADAPAEPARDDEPPAGTYYVPDFSAATLPVAPAAEPKPEKKPATGGPRATRLPADWVPDPDLVAWTRANAPAAANNTEVERFRDYGAAKAGADGRKVDWRATWRNWARKAQEQAARPAYRNQSQIMADVRHQAAESTARRQAALEPPDATQQGNALALITGSRS